MIQEHSHQFACVLIVVCYLYCVLVSAAFNCVVGGVYLIYHLLIQKSIIWSNFNLQSDDWELLQIGLVMFFLQVGRGST